MLIELEGVALYKETSSSMYVKLNYVAHQHWRHKVLLLILHRLHL